MNCFSNFPKQVWLHCAAFECCLLFIPLQRWRASHVLALLFAIAGMLVHTSLLSLLGRLDLVLSCSCVPFSCPLCLKIVFPTVLSICKTLVSRGLCFPRSRAPLGTVSQLHASHLPAACLPHSGACCVGFVFHVALHHTHPMLLSQSSSVWGLDWCDWTL